MKTFCINLLIIFITLVTGGCQKTAEIKTAEQHYKIIYNVAVDVETDDYEIFSMNPDGSEKKNITNSPGLEWTYYAYKNKIFFISDRDTCHRCYFLYEMDSEGNNVRKISGIQLADSWMSSRNDGSELIVRPSNKIDTAFYIINVESGSLISKLKPDLPYFSDPLFIPGSNKIVFRGSYSAFKKDRKYFDELFMINNDGNDLQQLTHYPEDDTTAKWYNYHAGPPKWHPTENFISYNSLQENKRSLYAITPDGKKQWKLTGNLLEEGWHDWSPDGKWLAIGISDSAETQFHIAIMNWKTKKINILTDTTYKYQQAPVFVEVQ